MLIGRGDTQDGIALILGMTRENVNRLTAGQPIRLRRETHGDGPEGQQIVIFFGEDEEDMVRQFKEAVALASGTHVISEPRLADNRQLGATGEYPAGKSCPEDEGGLRAALIVDRESNRLRIDFGKSLAWVELTKYGALAMAEQLTARAKYLK